MTMNEFIDKSFEPYQAHIKELEKENTELKCQVEKAKFVLERWHKQYSDKSYTETA